MLQVKSKILYNKAINNTCFHLVLQAPGIAKESLPGQFLNIKVNDADEPLLRRPLSIHRVKGASVGLLYEAVGQATKILSRRKPGEYLDVLGPLGTGFNYKPQAVGHGLQILVAGGMGVAPLVFLAEKLNRQSDKNKKSKVIALIGAKTKRLILCEKEFKDMGCEAKIATDDGSAGFKGYVCELLNKEISTKNHELLTIYACGPRLMLKEISRISKKKRIPAQVSLEEHMACGIGACLGCVINTENGYKRVCKEGPVLDAQEVIW